MPENKTVKTRASVKKFLDGVEHERKRADSCKLSSCLERSPE